MVGDFDWACDNSRRMWVKLGRTMAKSAHALADKGFAVQSLEHAKIAEVCFWQATGENPTIQMDEVSPSKSRNEAAA